MRCCPCRTTPREMALLLHSPCSTSLSLKQRPFPPLPFQNPCQFRGRRSRATCMADSNLPQQGSPKLVTFLGKGGSGKTAAAVLAAQYYAKERLRTCLVIHSQDPTAEYLMGCKIGTSPILCKPNLSVVRLETSKMLLEPLDRLKKADAHYNLTQGILQGVVGEELGVLPGMDSIFSLISIIKFMGYLKGSFSDRKASDAEFDIIVYDGLSSENTLRMICSFSQARLYLKYLRLMAEKTDIGRLSGPSILKLLDEAVRANSGYIASERSSSELWAAAEQVLQTASLALAKSSNFRCYLVMNPSSKLSVDAAMRYWGCAAQAGTHISGAFGYALQSSAISVKNTEKELSPLPFVLVPHLSEDSPIDWDAALEYLSKDVESLLAGKRSNDEPLVRFDRAKKMVILFMPGFDKSEIKLYQYRGGSELLVEARDQRRVIQLPSEIQGKVAGAKFIDRRLLVTLK